MSSRIFQKVSPTTLSISGWGGEGGNTITKKLLCPGTVIDAGKNDDEQEASVLLDTGELM